MHATPGFSSSQTTSPRSIGLALIVSLAIHALLLLVLQATPCSLLPADGVPLSVNACVFVRDDFACTLDDAVKMSPPAQFAFTVQDSPPSMPPPRQHPAISEVAPGTPGVEMVGQTPSSPGSAGEPGGHGSGGVWKGPSVFQVQGAGKSVVYVVDRSLSMGLNGALAAAKVELLDSLRQLPETVRFQVIFYNRQADPLRLQGRMELAAASAEHKRQAAGQIQTLRAEGSTDHVLALKRALTLQPEVIFLITDGANLTTAQIGAITHLNQGRTTLHAIELSRTLPGPDNSLSLLARSNRGTYRRASLAAPDSTTRR